jgi:putative flippase GtrA
MLKRHHQAHLNKFTKFCIVNGVTFALDLATVRTGIILGLSPFYTGISSFIILSIVSYFLLHLWVFHDHTTIHSRATILYALLVLGQALMVGYGISYLLHHTQLIPEVARTIVGVFVALVGYIVCHNFIFLPQKRKRHLAS